MIRPWSRALAALLALAALVGLATSARAAAEVHKFNLVLSAIPTSVDGGDFNRQIDELNRVGLQPFGLETLERITFGWQFDAELRYFIRPNVALAAGVGHLRSRNEREYLPALTSDIVLTAEVLSVPIHVGGDYYFTPYNQGDFRAQAYVGGGLLSLTSTRARLQLVALGLDPAFGPDPSFRTINAGDATGFYTEAGVHMFFALRYSVMLGAIYRSAEVSPTGVYYTGTDGVEHFAPAAGGSISASGVGLRASVAIGF